MGTNATQKVRRLFTEKRAHFAMHADELYTDLRQHLKVSSLERVRVLNRYDISGLTNDEYFLAVSAVFSDPVTDEVYDETVDLSDAAFVFAIESLPGQYNQRADSAVQCVQILTRNTKPECLVATVIALYGPLDPADFNRITEYLINPVESRLARLDKPETLTQAVLQPHPIRTVEGLTHMDEGGLRRLISTLGLAMSLADLQLIQEYFRHQRRDPTITEIRVLDTYWSDHCRHTTFLTVIEKITFPNTPMSQTARETYGHYLASRKRIYGESIGGKPISLMDLATMGMRVLKKEGLLTDLDESEEINACSIRVPVTIAEEKQDYLVMFKNETHNHPTEIEPFGGAATCLGGAIRDPLSGRAYVYQAMRVTGSGDPRLPLDQTIPGKLPQRKITTKAAAGYSSYGNQIGLATGYVEELYHPGYLAKRMEIGAVIAAAKASHVLRAQPSDGDLILLVGGRTGRDGCGGATGSSKEHTEESILTCGSEVQKGNPPTERKIQRLFRNPKASLLIKRCNDFGAGGVCVAIGELSDGIEVDLDRIPKKYEGLDGTELAISESQERMAVVVSPSDSEEFLKLCIQENLEAVAVAKVTAEPKMRMLWRGETILEIDRDFINTNGALQHADVTVTEPPADRSFFLRMPEGYREGEFMESLKSTLGSLQSCSRKGLVERFDSTIGAGSVLVPFGGRKQLSPEIGMVAKIPVFEGETQTATLMTFGFDPYLSEWSPYHGAYYAVFESLRKITAMGGDARKARLSFQEYFEKLGDDPVKWGKPWMALLGAYQAQIDFRVPAIGGKDSMSGTFMDRSVPPTLVSFAVAPVDASDVLSASMRSTNSTVIALPPVMDEQNLPDVFAANRQLLFIEKVKADGLVLSASTVREGGIAVAVAHMCFGNSIGFEFSSELECAEFFSPMPAAVILELSCCEDYIRKDPDFILLEALRGAKIIGRTLPESLFIFRGSQTDLSELVKAWESTLEGVFPTKATVSEPVEKLSDISLRHTAARRQSSYIKTAKPRVLIPVFPGTNCEWDTMRSFEKAGAIADVFVFNNLDSKMIDSSIKGMAEAIRKANILMIPGGFSAGDEPDGSGKFIAAVLRNPRLTHEIQKLLYERDGLILGICNGFQALIKLGLLPYGDIKPIEPHTPTLASNVIGRHVSAYVRTRVVTNRSPWLSLMNPGDVHLIPVSHGEGRFSASPDMIRALNENGQIATQYVDLDGLPTDQIPHNPNGSVAAIEGITALNGRILGKMGHSERTGDHIAINIEGDKEQPLFRSGVFYYS